MTSTHSLVLLLFAVMLLAFQSSYATPSFDELYWKTKVGNIPMPKSLKDSLGSNETIVKLNPNYKQDLNRFEAILYVWGGKVNKSQIPQDGREVYFSVDTLSKVGMKLKLYFKQINNEAKFLPLHVAKSMPTSSDKSQLILNRLSVNPKSILAQDIEMMMKTCEEKGVEGEKRNCVNSLQGMIDYVTSTLNPRKNKLMVTSTDQGDGILMEYIIQTAQKVDSHDNMVCHKIRNPYAVFLCHSIQSSDLYKVSLIGANGKQTTSFVNCHKDTSSWNPGHYAFEVLNTKPGGKPICHFLCAEAIVWYRSQDK